MKPFTIQELRLLLASRPGPCISLFLPTHRHHPGTEQDPIRFKNLLGTARGLLGEHYATKDVRAIDSALWELLREERAPLILAGVGYYHPLYQSVSRYPYLAEQGVEGNFEHSTPDEIHAKVWPSVRELFGKREEEVLNEYASRASQGQGTDDLHAIAQAAVNSRVRQLLIAEGCSPVGHIGSGERRCHTAFLTARHAR